MFNKTELCQFLVKAKKSTYAAGDLAHSIKENDGSTTLVFKDGNWKYHDNYFGGEPYGGREVVFFKGKPVYIMVYYGQVDESVTNVKKIYGILMNALKLIPEKNPYRGPKEYKENNFSYFNNFVGEINNFYGEEVIMENDEEIYSASYNGGFIALRN